MIGRWLREGRLWAVAAMVIVAALLPTTTVAASTFIYDAPADALVDTCAFAASAVGLSQLKDAHEASASFSVESRGTSTTSSRSFVATNTTASSVDDLLRPDGSLIGKAGTDASIREITGGLSDAQAMFQQLGRGGTIVEQTATLTRVQLPNGGFVQLRTVMARSPGTAATIDVNVPGLDITKLKFNP